MDRNKLLKITKLNNTYIHIDGDNGELRDLHEHFTIEIPNARFMSSYKSSGWDGKIRLFNSLSKKIYVGLLPEIVKFASKLSIDLQIEKSLYDWKKHEKDYFTGLDLQSNNKPLKPHKYQVEALTKIVNDRRSLLLSPTSSGKSLMIYGYVRYIDKVLKKDDKILIIVPTTNLVTQMKDDFNDYSSKSKWSEEKIQIIYAGKDKNPNNRIVVSTWQSIYKQKKEYFKQFKCVIVDEVHLAESKSIKGIMEKCEEAEYRLGTTGTLEDTKTHILTLQGLFEQVNKTLTTKELMDEGHISNLDIKCLKLDYKVDDCKTVKGMSYQEEIDFILAHKKRMKFIATVAKKLNGNTLILFNHKEKYGKPLKEFLDKSGKNIHYIDGSTKEKQRDNIKKVVNLKESNSILLATYGVLQLGINIPNLQNLIFAQPYKGKIRVLQSIGRVLRKDGKQNHATLFDIIDNLHHGNKENYLLKHGKQRIDIYMKEKLDFNILTYGLNST